MDLQRGPARGEPVGLDIARLVGLPPGPRRAGLARALEHAVGVVDDGREDHGVGVDLRGAAGPPLRGTAVITIAIAITSI